LASRAAFACLALAVATGAPARSATAQSVARDSTAARTTAEMKIDSHVLEEIRRQAGSVDNGSRSIPTAVRVDRRKRALVDVRAVVTPGLQKDMRLSGATIVSTSVEYHSIVAWMPLTRLLRLARNPEVIAIGPAAAAATIK
ncbi:MAG: hypothetical protein ACRD2I_10890, partial [Vicinamibacterales bacterium]